ncbi:MAG: tetratricopeptide repeat protein [bacterium]
MNLVSTTIMSVTALANLAFILKARRQFTDVEPLYLQALKIIEQAFESNHPRC